MAGQGSARVILNEIDLSQVQNPEVLPQGVPAAVVGTAKRGPAFVPHTFANAQQFSETFGPMTEKGKESNANRFGPLALNEWLRNSDAGTFVRVLGIGSQDGKMASDRTVTGAGFKVGDKISHESGELVVNPNAVGADGVNSVGSLKAARTHFLGCFMKDQGDSTFLQDAGIQTDDASAIIKIDFDPDNLGTGIPEVDSSIRLISALNGAQAGEDITYTFTNNDDSETNINLTAHTTPQLIATQLSSIITANHDNLSATVIQVDGADTPAIQIVQAASGEAGNTVITSDINATARDTIRIISNEKTITNSTTGDQIRMDGGGQTSAAITISVHDEGVPVNLVNDNTLKLKALKDDRTLTDEVTITFKDDANFAGDDDEVFNAQAGNLNLHVRIGENSLDTLEGQKETLTNLAAAINGSNGTQLEDLLSASLSDDGKTLTITQANKGNVDNTADASIRATVKFTMPAGSFEVQTTEATGAELTDHFTNGTDGSGTITFTFSDQPRVGDNFTLITADAFTNTFKFIANANGNSNGLVHTDTTSINVELGETLSGTVQNVRNAIESNDAAVVVDDKLTVENTDSTVTITQDTGGPTGDTLVTFNMSDKVTASTASSTLVGNFGTKTTSFAGGGGSASPIIRGLLMTPQGVVASLDLVNAAYEEITSFTPVAVATGENLNKFGENQALYGYEVGRVSLDEEQSFKLILNGYVGDETNIHDCSFNPESVNYFAKVLNTDPEKIEERGHFLYAHWDVDPSVARADVTGVVDPASVAITAESAAFCIPSSGNPRVSADNRPDFESFDTRFRTAASPWITSQSFGGEKYDLFRLHSLDDGAYGNDRFRVLISNIIAGSTDEEWGSFDLSLEAFDSDPILGEALVKWKNLTLDPDSRNYIGRIIGDKHMYFDFDKDDPTKQRLVEEGDFDLKNKYVRVELSDALKSDAVNIQSLPCGFKSYKTLNTGFAGLFDERGDANGENKQLAAESLDGMAVTPLPLVKTITFKSGGSEEASATLPWGVKLAKKKNSDGSSYKHSEIGEIRSNESIRSWTKFYPDMDPVPFAVDSSEDFSLEKIAVANPEDIDWSTAEYSRLGAAVNAKSFIELGKAAKKSKNVRYLKFRCLMQGGFDGVNIFSKDKSELNYTAAYREFNEEVANVFTGPTVEAYKKAIDVLADKSATEFQLLAIPDIRVSAVTDYAISACESRFDAMFVMDIDEHDESNAIILNDSDKKVHVGNTITKFESRALDTSFAAAYYPDVLMKRPSNNSILRVPPSVSMLGVMSLNDRLADPWFAPAGLTRGRLNARNVKVMMNRDTLNELYDADINPIYEPAGRPGEVYAFGQKTLMQSQSALDRINVRRLLINLRRKVKAVAHTLLFEPNRESTLNKFNALVEPIMSEVQARQGVERYKVVIDSSTTTQNDVENNTIRGKIYLQPTKSVEFISLDFVVTNSID